jgi:uncharacterized protein
MNSKVDAYIECLPEPNAGLAALIRELIFETVPQAEERLSFNIPFYHYYGMFCYINKVKGGMELVFCRGKDLLMTFPQLNNANRNIAAGIVIRNSKDIIEKEVRTILTAAADWQQQAWLEKKPFVKRKKTK